MMQMHSTYYTEEEKEEAERYKRKDEEACITSVTHQNQLRMANIWKETGLRFSSNNSHWSEMPDMRKEGGSKRRRAKVKKEEENEDEDKKEKNNCE